MEDMSFCGEMNVLSNGSYSPLQVPEREEEEVRQDDSGKSFESVLVYEREDESINLLSLEADINYLKLFVTLLMDVIYKNADEVINLDLSNCSRSRLSTYKRHIRTRENKCGIQKQSSTPSPLRRQLIRSRFKRSGLNIESLYAMTKEGSPQQQQVLLNEETNTDGSNSIDRQSLPEDKQQ
ncbi:unnamed protein product [Didymodactylos carnosus]|uniref:Uncharacterized protein n=1 Tax=Didymodactylos carnosus TaxID=1234261 RepID=A0A815L1R7_9BILA|nr:unnamed protein product [Didymodactylos carnosus]CAF4291464.1 unnamed protein product [Didymodactylos carnosus]